MSSHQVRVNLWYILGTLLLLVNIAAFALNATRVSRSNKLLHQYTFEEDDYPTYYPITLPMVSFTPENTIHYQIYSIDAAIEWASIFPKGGGFLYLGPNKRPFGLALFHQMHCLTRIREAMNYRSTSEHVRHCFNYLRQSILCEANPTIEPVIPVLGRRSVNPEVPRLCRDWSKVYELAEENYNNFVYNGTKT